MCRPRWRCVLTVPSGIVESARELRDWHLSKVVAHEHRAGGLGQAFERVPNMVVPLCGARAGFR